MSDSQRSSALSPSQFGQNQGEKVVEPTFYSEFRALRTNQEQSQKARFAALTKSKGS